MNKEKYIRIANILRNTARYTLLVVGILVFLFALASGAEEYGGGMRGVIKNVPNALPWLLLLAFLLLAWKRELPGGILIILTGLALMVFFFFMAKRFYPVVLIVTLLIVLPGVFFVLSWYLRRKLP
jgi:hypothetical protein